MGDKGGGTASESEEEEEWEPESDVRIQMIIGRYWRRGLKGSVGLGGGGGGNNWGYGQVTNECKRDIDKLGIGSGNGLDGDTSGMLGGNVDE